MIDRFPSDREPRSNRSLVSNLLSAIRRASGLVSAHQGRRLRIVPVVSNRSILDPTNSLVNHEQRYEEPFTRDHRLSEAILDLDVEPRRLEHTMDQVFELAT